MAVQATRLWKDYGITYPIALFAKWFKSVYPELTLGDRLNSLELCESDLFSFPADSMFVCESERKIEQWLLR